MYRRIAKLSGSEGIIQTGDLTIKDFWAWAYSDVLSNRNRSIFAEFLVASALNITDSPRIEWDAVDLRYHNKKIEVKSSAYVQGWQQTKLSAIKFDIGKKFGWDAETNSYRISQERMADCYVFCLFTEQDFEQADVLDTQKWKFFVVKTLQLEERFGNQKCISLNRLKEICSDVDFTELKRAIEKVLC